MCHLHKNIFQVALLLSYGYHADIRIDENFENLINLLFLATVIEMQHRSRALNVFHVLQFSPHQNFRRTACFFRANCVNLQFLIRRDLSCNFVWSSRCNQIPLFFGVLLGGILTFGNINLPRRTPWGGVQFLSANGLWWGTAVCLSFLYFMTMFGSYLSFRIKKQKMVRGLVIGLVILVMILPCVVMGFEASLYGRVDVSIYDFALH